MWSSPAATSSSRSRSRHCLQVPHACSSEKPIASPSPIRTWTTGVSRTSCCLHAEPYQAIGDRACTQPQGDLLMTLRSTLDFLLYDWLDAQSLTARTRFADHSRETFDAVLDTCERIAREKYAPFNRTVDIEEPHFDGEKVILPQATYEARKAYAESGLLSAAQDYEVGGMQLPYAVEAAANSFFAVASISIGSNLLTSGNANLLMVHGTEAQKQVFALNEFNGRWSGTMCLSEPQAGSSLSDVATRAVPDGDGFEADPLGARYRLTGNKMWISSGDHELTENIVHLVLAKIPGPDGKLVPGTKGISLFIVPKKLVDTEGKLTGVRNDVALAGLNHKLGWRGTTNTLLNFGEGRFPVEGKAGAVGYLVGQPGKGLHCMFHMMNEARIIEHADVKRMLLAQKSYGEGALALNLFCAKLVDEQHTGDAATADEARLLLEVLTPIAKSWPSEFCLEANSLAIQIHGGYGYTRDFPVEQYWRDNRLNMIHEGTHGIQAMDLLGRKVLMEGGRGLQLLAGRINATIERAIQVPALAAHPNALGKALQAVGAATKAAWATGQPADALANAVPYMQAFGHTVLAWVWLDVALATLARDADLAQPASVGRMGGMRFFFHYELPKIGAWLQVVSTRDATCAAFPEEAF